MRGQEKRRKFHEAVLSTLYPAETPKPIDEKPLNTSNSNEDFDVNLIPDDYGLQASKSSTSDDEGESECEERKLTRAQRKRLRKKKLKEDVSRRQQIIGPLLPPSSSDSGSAAEECPPGARRYARDSQSKLKQRRMAKRLGREGLKLSDVKAQSLEAPNADQHS